MTDNDRFAMLVGVSTYDSDAYRDLPPVRADLHYMRAVLENTEIGMYNDCAMVAEPTRAEMLHAVETFLDARQPSETALLYFSGHGEFCEDDNQLYFLTRDTDPDDLPGTAVPHGVPGTDAPVVPGLLQTRAAGLLLQRLRRPGLDLEGVRGDTRAARAEHPAAADRRVLHHRLRRTAVRVRDGAAGVEPRYVPVHRGDRGGTAQRAHQGRRLDHAGRPLRVPDLADEARRRTGGAAPDQVHVQGHESASLRPIGRPPGAHPGAAP